MTKKKELEKLEPLELAKWLIDYTESIIAKGKNQRDSAYKIAINIVVLIMERVLRVSNEETQTKEFDVWFDALLKFHELNENKMTYEEEEILFYKMIDKLSNTIKK